MTPDQALSQLRSIHLPPTPLPEAGIPLWALPVVAMVFALIGCIWWRSRRRKVWLRQTRDELRSIAVDAADGRAAQGWQRLAVLMRQVSLLHGDPAQAASVTGSHWLMLLDQMLQTDLFQDGPGRRLIDLPYRKPADSSDDDAQLVALCRQLTALIEGLARRADSLKPNDATVPISGSRAHTP